MDTDRSWINHQIGSAFKIGVDDFINVARNHLDKRGRTRCLCTKCKKRSCWAIDEVKDHLYVNGMKKDYICWEFHGEPEVLSDDDYDKDDNNANSGFYEGIHDMLSDLRSARGVGVPNIQLNENEDYYAMNTNLDHLLRKAREPLYPGCKKFTMLDFLVKLLHVKVNNRASIKCFNDHLEPIKEAFPEGETLPSSYTEAKSLMRSLGLGHVLIHACKYVCALFWKDYEDFENCPVCGESRYKIVTSKGKKIPQKVLRYFPLKPTLRRLYMSRMTAEDMRWHKEKNVQEKNVFKHPEDSQVWQELDKSYGWFAKYPRNVRPGIATDGFNPFSDMSSTYSMWPVLVLYNLPP